MTLWAQIRRWPALGASRASHRSPCTLLQLKRAGNTRAWCHQGMISFNCFHSYRLNKWLSMQIISTAVRQTRVALAWLVVKELTCKHIVVVVDVVQFDPFIQHVKLICSQHLSLPVRVTWVMTDHRSVRHIQITSQNPVSDLSALAHVWVTNKSPVVWSETIGAAAGAVMMSQFRWVTGMFLVAKKQDRGKPEGLDEKDASLSP